MLYACALGLRGESGGRSAPLTASMVTESCVLETLPDDPGLRSDFISERCSYYQRSLDIGQGRLLQAVHFQGRNEGRLFLVIHHLVVDGVSWRVLLGDLEQAYGQLSSGKPIQLAPKSSSYQQWGQALAAYATSGALQNERALLVRELEPGDGSLAGAAAFYGSRRRLAAPAACRYISALRRPARC